MASLDSVARALNLDLVQVAVAVLSGASAVHMPSYRGWLQVPAWWPMLALSIYAGVKSGVSGRSHG